MRICTHAFWSFLVLCLILTACEDSSSLLPQPQSDLHQQDAELGNQYPLTSSTPLEASKKDQTIGVLFNVIPRENSVPLSSLYYCNLSGSCTPLYFFNSSVIASGDLSPDRQKLIVTLIEQETDSADLYLLNLTAGTWNRLTSDKTPKYVQDWSQDKPEILFISYFPNPDPAPPQIPIGKLAVMNYELIEQRELEIPCNISKTKWLSGKDDVLFSGICEDKQGIFMWKPGETMPQLLTSTKMTDFSLSPDRKDFIFNSIGSDGMSQIFIFNLEDSSIDPLPHVEGSKDFGGEWISPDGNEIAFVTTRFNSNSAGEVYTWDRKTDKIYPAPWKDEEYYLKSEGTDLALIGYGVSTTDHPTFTVRDEQTGNEIPLNLPIEGEVKILYFGWLPGILIDQPLTIP